MKRGVLLALMFASLALSVVRPVSAVIISAPFLTVGVGDTFTVQISVTDAVDLASFQFDLAFAPSIVEANEAGASAGADLPGDWFFTSPGAVDNTNGDIIGVSAFGSAFSGSGVIASFQFTALSPGIPPLDFSNVFLNFSDTGFQVLNGEITMIGPAQASEPATLALLASGLLLLGARCLLRRQANH